ncbi:energy transducer TonB [Pelagicoccus mobilis]|uniref:TonB family protein n=1 Tax=Pelagicoccus mobilis TaxID=415221 RepID=A0A934S5R0_9BACT|nr:energy transducer TonB [Pelagicoccus mobilis]MBK1880257.1 TonB family protein [Pelagicoccus mobilis]
MFTRLNRLLVLGVAGCFPILAASADVYTTESGTAYDGQIVKVLDNTVYLRVGEERVEEKLSKFDADSKAAIESWIEANPQSVDVYTKWDVQPRIVSSSMPNLPEQYLAEEFKGMVSVDLVLNENGQVIHASIKKSTHADLEAPALDAAKTWIFEPAKVGGKMVKSKLRVPFRFVNTPPPPAEEAEPTA